MKNVRDGKDSRYRGKSRNKGRAVKRPRLLLLLVFLVAISGLGEIYFGADARGSFEYFTAQSIFAIETQSDASIQDEENGDCETDAAGIDLADIPAWSGVPYVEVNGNVPAFSEEDLTEESFETYSELDALGRCGVAYACIGKDLMPTEARGDISSIHPTGWQSVQYEGIDGESLYNRCHLIAYSLTAENANERNLITGTRYLNTEGMLPFEEKVAAYIDETGNHVRYRVTPIFEGDNLLVSGVQMEAMSVEDDGEGIQFNVYCYNVQPGIGIDYATGDNWLEDADALAAAAKAETSSDYKTEEAETGSLAGETAADTIGTTYILNKNTMKFHLPSCESVDEISEKNKLEYTGERETVIAMGYEPCKRCNP